MLNSPLLKLYYHVLYQEISERIYKGHLEKQGNGYKQYPTFRKIHFMSIFGFPDAISLLVPLIYLYGNLLPSTGVLHQMKTETKKISHIASFRKQSAFFI